VTSAILLLRSVARAGSRPSRKQRHGFSPRLQPRRRSTPGALIRRQTKSGLFRIASGSWILVAIFSKISYHPWFNNSGGAAVSMADFRAIVGVVGPAHDTSTFRGRSAGNGEPNLIWT
jgi:hypothetical protein